MSGVAIPDPGEALGESGEAHPQGVPPSRPSGRTWLGGTPERSDPPPLRRRGKEVRERLLAALLLVPTSPVLLACSVAIKLEGLFDPNAKGPVFFVEERVSRGRVIPLLKFRVLDAEALASLGDGPTHIKRLEKQGHVTRAGRIIRQWYLDELPQLLNIVRGDMFLIGTRPWPVDVYEDEMRAGPTRKYDMPAGLVGPVQSRKGVQGRPGEQILDAEYWEAFRLWRAWRLLRYDARILWDSAVVQLRHQGL